MKTVILLASGAIRCANLNGCIKENKYKPLTIVSEVMGTSIIKNTLLFGKMKPRDVLSDSEVFMNISTFVGADTLSVSLVYFSLEMS